MKAAASKAPSKKKAVQIKKRASSGPHELVKSVQDGLRFGHLEALRSDLGLPLDQVAEKLGISRATLHRRKASGRLNLDESDRVLRFARLLKQAAEVFGGTERARLWLSFPQWGLGGAVPLDYARTEIGAREVEKLLHRVEHSVYV